MVNNITIKFILKHWKYIQYINKYSAEKPKLILWLHNQTMGAENNWGQYEQYKF